MTRKNFSLLTNKQSKSHISEISPFAMADDFCNKINLVKAATSAASLLTFSVYNGP